MPFGAEIEWVNAGGFVRPKASPERRRASLCPPAQRGRVTFVPESQGEMTVVKPKRSKSRLEWFAGKPFASIDEAYISGQKYGWEKGYTEWVLEENGLVGVFGISKWDGMKEGESEKAQMKRLNAEMKRLRQEKVPFLIHSGHGPMGFWGISLWVKDGED